MPSVETLFKEHVDLHQIYGEKPVGRKFGPRVRRTSECFDHSQIRVVLLVVPPLQETELLTVPSPLPEIFGPTKVVPKPKSIMQYFNLSVLILVALPFSQANPVIDAKTPAKKPSNEYTGPNLYECPGSEQGLITLNGCDDPKKCMPTE